MKKVLLFIFCMFLSASLSQAQGQRSEVVPTNGVSLWTETFGSPEQPALLLVMGAATQGIFWPDEFCRKLADKGFFVIRYDHRDTGQSSTIDMDNSPYTTMDLTKDAVGILDHYKIQKAHWVGVSMGGQIAQFAGAYFPDRVLTLTLACTSTRFEELFAALEGKERPGALSPPLQSYLDRLSRIKKNNTPSQKEQQKNLEAIFAASHGSKLPFDKELYSSLIKKSFVRGSSNPSHHWRSMKASFEEHKKAPALITAPTLILQGSEDPIFPPDHGQALKKEIPHSKLVVLEGMGHLFPTVLYDEIIQQISTHARK